MTKKQKYLLAFALTVAFSLGLFFLQDKLLHLKALGLIGLFLISVFSAILFIPSPVGIASVVAAGTAFPTLLVALIASLGSSVGDLVAYLIGYTGREAFIDTKKLRHQVIQDVFEKHGGLFIFFIALVPNPFFDAIGVVAGLFFYPVKRFFIYIFLGRLLRNLLLAYLGHRL